MRKYFLGFALISVFSDACGGFGPRCPKYRERAYASIFNRTGQDIQLPVGSDTLNLTASSEEQNLLFHEKWVRPQDESRPLGKFTPPGGDKRKYGSLNMKNRCEPGGTEHRVALGLIGFIQPADVRSYLICESGVGLEWKYYIFLKGDKPTAEVHICYIEKDGSWKAVRPI